MLAHVAYFEKLNSLNDYSPEWPVTAAGLVVLRLVDAWFREGAEVIRRDRAGLEAARQAIARLADTDPIRPLLSEIVDIAEQSEVAIVQWVSPYLWRYGDTLERQGQWACAHDVFCSTRQHAQTGGDPWLTMWSALRAGPLARQLADLDAADTTFAIAAQTAKQIDHVEGRLRARIGVAKNILVRRGDPTQAIIIMRSIEAEARLHCSPIFVSTVLHQLAHLAFLKQDYDTATKLNTDALQSTDDPDAIERIKGSIAASLAYRGHSEAARKMNLSLLTRAREEYMRQNALLNLLELAAQDNDKPLFERYRQELADAPFPARTRAIFHLFAGQGLQAFGQAAAAQEELRHALAITIEYGLTDILPVIRANLYTLGRPTSTVV